MLGSPWEPSLLLDVLDQSHESARQDKPIPNPGLLLPIFTAPLTENISWHFINPHPYGGFYHGCGWLKNTLLGKQLSQLSH